MISTWLVDGGVPKFQPNGSQQILATIQNVTGHFLVRNVMSVKKGCCVHDDRKDDEKMRVEFETNFLLSVGGVRDSIVLDRKVYLLAFHQLYAVSINPSRHEFFLIMMIIVVCFIDHIMNR
mmetsp:Transcript_26165/g.36889  ORF Transcript_26165/g.36889 Transcript_26165/m.36889 type:complete len:121 (-) Transcript_26165:64-426(-)